MSGKSNWLITLVWMKHVASLGLPLPKRIIDVEDWQQYVQNEERRCARWYNNTAACMMGTLQPPAMTWIYADDIMASGCQWRDVYGDIHKYLFRTSVKIVIPCVSQRGREAHIHIEVGDVKPCEKRRSVLTTDVRKTMNATKIQQIKERETQAYEKESKRYASKVQQGQGIRQVNALSTPMHPFCVGYTSQRLSIPSLCQLCNLDHINNNNNNSVSSGGDDDDDAAAATVSNLRNTSTESERLDVLDAVLNTLTMTSEDNYKGVSIVTFEHTVNDLVSIPEEFIYGYPKDDTESTPSQVITAFFGDENGKTDEEKASTRLIPYLYRERKKGKDEEEVRNEVSWYRNESHKPAFEALWDIVEEQQKKEQEQEQEKTNTDKNISKKQKRNETDTEANSNCSNCGLTKPKKQTLKERLHHVSK